MNLKGIGKLAFGLVKGWVRDQVKAAIYRSADRGYISEAQAELVWGVADEAL